MVPAGADPVKRVRILGPPNAIHALLGILTPRIPDLFVVGSDPNGYGPASPGTSTVVSANGEQNRIVLR